MRYYFFLLFSFFLAAEEEHLVVRLSLDKELLPLYIYESPIPKGKNESYFKDLKQVLFFDLNYNGSCVVKKVESSSQKAFENLTLDKESKLYKDALKSKGIPILLKPVWKENSLHIDLFSLLTEKPVRLGPICLENNLNIDRRKIHALADEIHFLLFQKQGVASTHLLYSQTELKKKEEWASEIYECDYDGGNPRKLTNGNGYAITPCYIPPENNQKKSTYFLYVAYAEGQPKIFLSALKEGKGSRLIPMTGNQLMPAISLNREEIAFISDIAGNPDLFLQSFDPLKGLVGKPRQIFAAKLATQGSPSFSPDGKKIAFVSNKDGSVRVYLMTIPHCNLPLSKIKPVLISKTTKGATAPSWSPDGKKIAYCALNQGTRQIFIYDLAEEREYPLTEGKGNKENPTWAPDSLHLCYNSSSQDGGKLYMINLNQKEAVPLPLGGGEKRFPSWEPILP